METYPSFGKLHLVNYMWDVDNISGCMICHSSAGVGRTGTILMVILLKEMLENQSEIESMDVLKKIREHRGKLVEDVVQFNFAIQVFEEVVFGNKTATTIDDFMSSFNTRMNESQDQYFALKNIPTHVTYIYSAGEKIAKLNRNNKILSPDQSRIYLEMVIEEEVRIINHFNNKTNF